MRFLFRRGWMSRGLAQTQPRRSESFRPRLERLEDRTLLDASGLPSGIVSYLGTPAGQVFLGEIISQSQYGTITSNQAAQDVANAAATVHMLTALGWSPSPSGSPAASGLTAPLDFLRSPAGLIYIGETMGSSSGTATQNLLLAEAGAAALAALGILPQPAGPQGAQGAQGSPGPQGVPGPAGTSSSSTFSAYNDTLQIIPNDGDVTFTNTGPNVGTDVLVTSPSTFTITTAGVYRIDFVLNTDPDSAYGSVTILQNGIPIPQSTVQLNVLGAPLVGMVTLNAIAGDVISIQSNSPSPIPPMTLDSAQILITKLGDNQLPP